MTCRAMTPSVASSACQQGKQRANLDGRLRTEKKDPHSFRSKRA